MYPKLAKVRSGSRNVKEIVYLRLMKRVKVNGVWKEQVVANLGRQDIYGRKALGELLKKLRRFTDEILVTPEEIESKEAKDYGSVLVGQKLWQEIGLGKWIKEVCGKPLAGSLGEPGVLAMVLNRLIRANSKLALYDWMPTVYLPQWQGKRFELPDEPEVFAERFYRTMDWLISGKNKEKIEECIADWAMTLFPVEVVFYDITNVQLEGWERLKQARYGHIRLGRKNHKQILLGIVMVDNLPAASHIFRGNRAEKTTLTWVHKKLKKQFLVGRVVFVIDRGMVSGENLTEIEAKGDGYIVALKRRRCEEVEPLLYEEISSFTPIQYGKGDKPTLLAWEAPPKDGKRLIVVLNIARAVEEKAKRDAVIRELENDLKDLELRVKSGKLKKIKAIVSASERIISKKHGKRYFTYCVPKEGQFEFGLNLDGLRLEEALDGKFVIKTTESNLSLREVVFKYKDLMDVEDSFRDLKDFIKVAPVFHWKYRRVKAHIFICVLALLLERYLERKLKKAGLDHSARKAFEKLRNIKVVTNQVGHLLLKYVTPPTKEIERLLAACGIFKLNKILPDFEKAKPLLNGVK